MKLIVACIGLWCLGMYSQERGISEGDVVMMAPGASVASVWHEKPSHIRVIDAQTYDKLKTAYPDEIAKIERDNHKRLQALVKKRDKQEQKRKKLFPDVTDLDSDEDGPDDIHEHIMKHRKKRIPCIIF